MPAEKPMMTVLALRTRSMAFAFASPMAVIDGRSRSGGVAPMLPLDHHLRVERSCSVMRAGVGAAGGDSCRGRRHHHWRNLVRTYLERTSKQNTQQHLHRRACARVVCTIVCSISCVGFAFAFGCAFVIILLLALFKECLDLLNLNHICM